MKRMLLIALGFVPLLIGLGMNSWMLDNLNRLPPLKTLGVLVLLFWVFLGFFTSGFEKTPFRSGFILHLPALFVLLAVLFQELVLGRYPLNFFGAGTQFFYLPVLHLASLLIFWSSKIPLIYVVAFLLMGAAYLLGVKIKAYRMYL